VARDRKRAKQRRDRARGRATTVARGGESGGDGALRDGDSNEIPAAEVALPGALEHASADVDEFDAALVRGAGGVPAPIEEQELPDGSGEQELPDGTQDALQTPAGFSGGGGRGGAGGGGSGHGGGGDSEAGPSGAPLRGGNRVTGFLGASWAELQRVQWPDRRQVTQATAVVLGFVAIAGAYLGLADYVAKEIVEFIL
jgi:preprotein translocase subunit SecE